MAPPDTARAAENDRFVETLRNRTTRSLTTNERTKIASIAKERPSIDLEINFEFNSAGDPFEVDVRKLRLSVRR